MTYVSHNYEIVSHNYEIVSRNYYLGVLVFDLKKNFISRNFFRDYNMILIGFRNIAYNWAVFLLLLLTCV